jgi:hypothetical protein
LPGGTDREEKRIMSKPSAPSLQSIPGVGPSLARDLEDLGLREVADLRGRDPEQMYRTLCDMRGARIDRCVLYVFRCAVYYAERSRHDPELLKWWNWQDDRRQPVRRPTKTG